MQKIKVLAALLAVIVPTLCASLPAQALTSRQYLAQGHGRYVNSSGTRVRGYHGRFHHRHWHHRRHHRSYR